MCEARENGQNAKIKDLGVEGQWRAHGRNEGLALLYLTCLSRLVAKSQQCCTYGPET